MGAPPISRLMRVRWTTDAADDLERSATTSQRNVLSARGRVAQSVVERIGTLETFPHRGGPVVSRGRERSRTCKGLELSGGGCDSAHLFWNRSGELHPPGVVVKYYHARSTGQQQDSNVVTLEAFPRGIDRSAGGGRTIASRDPRPEVTDATAITRN